MQTQSGGQVGGMRAALSGLVPGALTVVVMLLGIALTTAVRLVLSPQGFDSVQAVVVPVLGVTILIATIIYSVACVRAMRRVRALETAGDAVGARGVLWGLVLTAVIVLVPIVVSALYPQHPAP